MSRVSRIDPAWQARLAEVGMADVSALLDESPASGRFPGKWQALTKPGLGRRERWRWEFQCGGAAHVLYVKRYARAPWRAQLDRIRRQSARHSTAWWEYDQAAQLAGAHVPSPTAVAVAEDMVGAIERRSVVVLESVSGDAFDRAWPALEQRRAPVTRHLHRHEIARRLARFVAAFHQTGTCHRDLYLCHVFAVIDPEGRQPPEFALIDLARTHAPRLRRMRWLLKDLAQLDASARQIGAQRSDRWRFLLAYLGLQPRAARARWYAARIQARSNRILQRIRRRAAS